MKRFLSMLFAIAGVLCMVYYIGMGLYARFNQSLLWIWPLLSCLFLAHHILMLRLPCPRWIIICVHTLLALFLVLFISVECVIFKAAKVEPEPQLDYVIVLGARVNGLQPSGALRYRIAAAADYAKNNPETVIIASGGQGDDEIISEAECIRRELTEQYNIDESRIIMEDQSTSTRENIQNSIELVKPSKDARIGIITNNFHIYRSLKLARNLYNYDFSGIPVVTSKPSFPHYMIREFAALVVEFLQGAL